MSPKKGKIDFVLMIFSTLSSRLIITIACCLQLYTQPEEAPRYTPRRTRAWYPTALATLLRPVDATLTKVAEWIESWETTTVCQKRRAPVCKIRDRSKERTCRCNQMAWEILGRNTRQRNNPNTKRWSRIGAACWHRLRWKLEVRWSAHAGYSSIETWLHYIICRSPIALEKFKTKGKLHMTN